MVQAAADGAEMWRGFYSGVLRNNCKYRQMQIENCKKVLREKGLAMRESCPLNK